jgi:hypothetical protein
MSLQTQTAHANPITRPDPIGVELAPVDRATTHLIHTHICFVSFA